MAMSGPIMIIDDDSDDQELLNEIFKELKVPNLTRFFDSCKHALDYLLTTIETPLLIISDINLPAMTGLEFCKKIMDNESLRVKNIPFVFLTTSNDQKVIAEAYEMSIEGFFVKPTSIGELKNLMRMIIDYWTLSRRPCIK